ncbi:MAG TPA: hypothetical protein DCW90_24460 [Lachnospiraceae bacterium]|nr:hypothetical protein [uncultured Lachnoclostridium sp.]HAU88508.1 hypothetical protein [Lachnospiraceae bacterium]
MSDLSSNSMSRDELIRSARANCMRQIDNPQTHTGGELTTEDGTSFAFKKGTYIRLFLSCLILLGVLAVKQFGLSYGGYNFDTVVTVVEDNHHFEKLQMQMSKTLEDKVIPTFQQIINSDKKE